MVKIMHTGEKPIVCIQRLYCNPEDTKRRKKVWINVDLTLFQRRVSTGSVFRFCGPINSNSVILNDHCMAVHLYVIILSKYLNAAIKILKHSVIAYNPLATVSRYPIRHTTLKKR